MTVTYQPETGYTCKCPEPHPEAPANAPEADVYLRISQDRTGQMLGVERQLPPVCRMLAAMNIRIGRVWVDNDISATTGRYRPAFEGLLKANPKIIAAWHPDRLVRMSRELERVIELNVPVYSAT